MRHGNQLAAVQGMLALLHRFRQRRVIAIRQSQFIRRNNMLRSHHPWTTPGIPGVWMALVFLMGADSTLAQGASIGLPASAFPEVISGAGSKLCAGVLTCLAFCSLFFHRRSAAIPSSTTRELYIFACLICKLRRRVTPSLSTSMLVMACLLQGCGGGGNGAAPPTSVTQRQVQIEIADSVPQATRLSITRLVSPGGSAPVGSPVPLLAAGDSTESIVLALDAESTLRLATLHTGDSAPMLSSDTTALALGKV
jgi:hypothetical protein